MLGESHSTKKNTVETTVETPS